MQYCLRNWTLVRPDICPTWVSFIQGFIMGCLTCVAWKLTKFCMKMGPGKSTYTFSAERLRISAFRSPARWLYPLKPGGEQKAEDVRQKMYTSIYPDPMKMLNWKDFEVWVGRIVNRHNSAKRGWDTDLGRLAQISQTIGSLFRASVSKQILLT